MTLLSEKQIQFYHSEGYLLVAGLIPQEVVSAGTEAMTRHLKEPSTNLAELNPALTACYSPAILAAAAQLVGDPVETFHAPDSAFPIVSKPSDSEWSWPQPHIDHSIKEHDHDTFPKPFRIASMLFLSDVATHGGGTIVWPRSQAKIEALAHSDPARFEKMWTLNQFLHEALIGEPIELTPNAGDILFYHCLLAHAGSKNITPVPRLAMNRKW